MREEEEQLDWETIRKLTTDLREAGLTLGRDEARFLVDAYYRMQEQRIRFDAQVREMVKEREPHELLVWFGDQSRTLENEVKKALEYYSLSTPAGRWLRSVFGIGPVIASGLTAHIDISKVEYAGQVWSFAGMNPSAQWKKGEKRPWNAELKTLCYKLGESFVMTKNNDKDFYGHLFQQRKDKEWAKNMRGDNADAAAAKAEVVGKDTVAYKWYSGQVNPDWAKAQLDAGKSFPEKLPKAALKDGIPMLPPAHVHARARRWVSKLLLSHLFKVMYIAHHDRIPEQPFVLTMDDHSREIHVPDLDLWMDYEGISL